MNCTIRGQATLAGTGTPIIVLTAHAMAADRDRALSLGCADHHAKPVDFPRLLEQMEAQLRNRAEVG